MSLHTAMSYILKTHFNIISLSCPRSSKFSFPLKVPDQYFVFISYPTFVIPVPYSFIWSINSWSNCTNYEACCYAVFVSILLPLHSSQILTFPSVPCSHVHYQYVSFACFCLSSGSSSSSSSIWHYNPL